MKIHVFDNGMPGKKGHHYNLNKAIGAYCAQHQIPVIFYLLKETEADICAELPVRPIFSNSIYRSTSSDPVCARLEDFFVLNKAFQQDLNKLDRQDFPPDDIILVPTAMQNMLGGLGGWLRGFKPNQRPKVFILLAFTNFYSEAVKASNMVYYRYGLAKSMPRKGIRLAASSQKLADFYGKFAGRSVEIVPMPNKIYPAKAMGVSPKTFYISVLGYSRRLKGFHLLPEVIDQLVAKKIPFHMDIQWTEEENLKDIKTALDQRFDHITLHGGTLSEEAYAQLLTRAHISLLPYNPAHYRYSGSGVFSESMAAGKVLVLPENTWMAQEADKAGHGAILFQKHDADDVTAAILQAMADFPALQKKATEGSSIFNQNHGINHFMTQVLAGVV